MKDSRLLRNVFFGFGGQAIIIILGIVVPRMMITSYGSDVNGLLGTITQIFSYLALFEAGIGQAARNALMKPLSQKDNDSISYITSVAKKYFDRFSIYYGIGVLALAGICPFVIKTRVNGLTIFVIILLEGMSGVLSFSQLQTISCVLSADGRSYVNNGINVVNKIVGYLAKIIMAYYGVNIILLEVVYFLITIGKVLFYNQYFKKHYSWMEHIKVSREDKLNDRNSYVLTEIAWTVFSSTDLIVLSVFVDTKVASVYVVYNMVFNSVGLLMNSGYFSVNYILGQTFHKDIEQYKKLHDAFTSVFFGGMTCLMCTAYLLVVPFVRLYTNGVTDVDYIISTLPIMFALVQMLSWSRYVTGYLSGIAGFANVTSKVSLIEAILNIVLSIALVMRFGIYGVLFATVISLPIKVIFLTWLSEKKILKRNSTKYVLILGVNFMLFGVTVWVSNFIKLSIESYKDFFVLCPLILLCFVLIGVCVNFMVNPNAAKVLKELKKEQMTCRNC